jgi:transcriptional regulator with XRE-family HTH domain
LTRSEFRANRLRLGLTQGELARRFGMSRNTITRWELGLLSLPRIAQWAMKGLAAEDRGRPTRRRSIR